MTDPRQDFARLMVAQSNGEPKPQPKPKSYGLTRDPKTGEVRPKKAAGRPRKDPVQDPELVTDTVPLNQDPDPGWMQPDAKKLPTPEEVTQQVKDDMAGFLGLAVGIVGPPLVNVDAYCGGALISQSEAIVDAAIPLMCRSATLVKFFSDEKSSWLQWMMLGKALWPVAQAVGRHHIFGSIKIVEDERGDKFAVPKDFSEFTTEPQAA